MNPARSVLVTGGAGFIGSHLVDALVLAGHRVVSHAMEGCDAVFHLGALGSVPRSMADPIASDQVNATGGQPGQDAVISSRSDETTMASAPSSV